MKPYQHAVSTARKYGGAPAEYQHFHDFFDQSKAAMPDIRHRAVLHHGMGIFILEKCYGPTFTNSIGKVISVRDIGEQHVLEDMGFIPSLEDWLEPLAIEKWHGGLHRLPRDLRADADPREVSEALTDAVEPVAPNTAQTRFEAELQRARRRLAELQQETTNPSIFLDKRISVPTRKDD